MMKNLFLIALLLLAIISNGQNAYKDSLTRYINDYVKNHEVVTGDNKKNFRFFPVDEKYKITAVFERATDSKWFNMPTSGTMQQAFRKYGTLKFVINDTMVSIPVYQSQMLMQLQKYKDNLFLPFTDNSSGEETYAAGRYIDITTNDIVNNKVVIDFNKAYNPYCAYVSGKYNCPIPPEENQLPVYIAAGEKTFTASH